MLSRAADAIYWMNRYIERAENAARFVEVNSHLMLDLPDLADEQWEPLVTTTGDREFFLTCFQRADRESVIEFLTFDDRNPNSIASCLYKARENARSIREIISSEMWEQVNRFHLIVKEGSRNAVLESPHGFFTRIKVNAHLLYGITDATMSHNEAWQFGRLGRYLERADQTSRILDVKYFILLPTVSDVGTPFDNIQWSALLKSASALEMYRKKYGQIAPDRVAEFLMLDRDFPRSIRFSLRQAERALRIISGSGEGTITNAAEREVGRLHSELDYAQIEEIIESGLHEFLDVLQLRLITVGSAVASTFFNLHTVA
ncbi:MAG: alpha-E domain-containing protein [Acidobacteriota bacterium]|nr:MAG: alpha-E domain-containing protein [Acidobacteriota bacterium]